jgi:hypothetical protein
VSSVAKGRVRISRGTYGLWALQHLSQAWTLEARLERQLDTLVVAEVRVVPRSRGHVPGAPWWETPRKITPGGVPATVLRTIALGEVYDEVRRILDDLATWRDDKQAEDARAVWLAGLREAPRRPGRRGRDDSYYARVAALYVDLLATGSRRPVVELAGQLGGGHRRGAAVQLVHEARRRGLLTKSQSGTAGGELTAKARKLLGEGEGR